MFGQPFWWSSAQLMSSPLAPSGPARSFSSTPQAERFGMNESFYFWEALRNRRLNSELSAQRWQRWHSRPTIRRDDGVDAPSAAPIGAAAAAPAPDRTPEGVPDSTSALTLLTPSESKAAPTSSAPSVALNGNQGTEMGKVYRGQKRISKH